LRQDGQQRRRAGTKPDRVAVGAGQRDCFAAPTLQILEDRKDDQGVIDRYSSLNDKYKRTSWALWTLADAEKHLNLPRKP